MRTLDFQARRKPVLIAAVSFLGVLGIALGLIPLVQSLQPNARAIAALPRVSMPDLAPGDYARVKTNMRFNQMDTEVLFIRRHSGQLDTWTLYTKAGWWYYQNTQLGVWVTIFAETSALIRKCKRSSAKTKA